MSEIIMVDGTVYLLIIMVLISLFIYLLNIFDSKYTIFSYQCLRCNYKYESKNKYLTDLVMFYHRKVCRGK